MTKYILTKTKAYGCTGEDPETSIAKVGTKQDCIDTMHEIGDECGYEVDYDDNTARWVDPDMDTVTVLEIHKVQM